MNEYANEAVASFGHIDKGQCATADISADIIHMEVDSDQNGVRGFSLIDSDGTYTDIGIVARSSDENDV